MHNLSVNLAAATAPSINLLVDSATTTPRTPEILNSLIAMTNPLDGYAYGSAKSCSRVPASVSSDSNSSSSSQLESPTNNPPSVQQTCSQLIKAGLKLSIEQKRKQQSDGEDLLDLDKCKRVKRNECSEEEEERNRQDGMQNWPWYEKDEFSKLTPEDEERRRRRRERNKIAATKCRLKKREKTAQLVTESETLESQNIELKNQMQQLHQERSSLLDMLNAHRPLCQNGIVPVTRLPPVEPQFAGAAYARFKTPPSIVVEEAPDFQPHLTNLDDAYHYNLGQCHGYPTQSYASSGMDNGCMA